MANTVPASVILPDPLTLLPGQPLRATTVRYLLGSLNACTAELHASTVICQQWEAGVAEHASATPEDEAENPIPLAFWRLPVITDRHTVLRILARAERSNADNIGTLTLRSRHAADEISVELDVDAEDDWIEVGELTIAEGEDEPFEDVSLFLETAGAGTTAKLFQIVAIVKPLSSPLPAQTVSGAVPFGLGAAVAEDRPLPAARGHQIIDTLAALYERPRVVQAWSGLDAAYSGVDASSTMMPEHGVVSMAPQGAVQGDIAFAPSGWAYVEVGGEDAVVIDTGSVEGRPQGAAIAPVVDDWTEIDGNADGTHAGIEPIVTGSVRLVAQCAVEGAGPRAGLYLGSSIVRSLTLWGE